MGRATLEYHVRDLSINLFSDLLFNIDKYTSQKKNDKELFDSFSKDDYFRYFVSQNKGKGSFVIRYVDNICGRKELPVLYDERPIVIDDAHDKGLVSESEYARRSLLNSKEQLYSKLFLLNNAVDCARKYNVLVDKQESDTLNRYGIQTFDVGPNLAVSIEDLIRFRSTHSKLGEVRDIYEAALDLWKEKMDSLPYDDIYFLSREYRIINKYYNRIRNYGLSVENLSIDKSKCEALHNGIKLRTMTPLLISSKRKNKTRNKNISSNFS